MEPKTFTAISMAAALAAVKRELGPDAVIVRTRGVRKGGVLGVGQQTVYEITAAAPEQAPPTRTLSAADRMARAAAGAGTSGAYGLGSSHRSGAPPAASSTAPTPRSGVRGLAPREPIEVRIPRPARPQRKTTPESESHHESQPKARPVRPATGVTPIAPAASHTISDHEDDRTDRIESEILKLRSMMDDVLRAASSPTRIAGIDHVDHLEAVLPAVAPPDDPLRGASRLLAETRDRLGSRGVPQAMLEAVIAAASAELSASELGDQGIIDATLARLFAQRIAVRRLDLTRGGPHVVALLGSTGVGKTTTIAKLAALLRLRHGRRVALVTADTYRIAAVDQLRTYAEIIGLTFRVCMTPQDVARARADLVRSHDVVIIDTPGRGPRDAGRVGDLAELVDAAAPDERHLVVSAGGHPAAIGEVSARFAPTSPDRLLLTKLDEAHGLGMIAAASSATGLPISYLTTGQEVPDDIEPPTPERLGQLIVLSDPADMEGPA